MPDRSDQNPVDGDDDILDEPVSVDSVDAAGIDLLGTHTAQVPVSFPSAEDDDLVDDDLADEIDPAAFEVPPVGAATIGIEFATLDTAEAEIVDDHAEHEHGDVHEQLDVHEHGDVHEQLDVHEIVDDADRAEPVPADRLPDDDVEDAVLEHDAGSAHATIEHEDPAPEHDAGAHTPVERGHEVDAHVVVVPELPSAEVPRPQAEPDAATPASQPQATPAPQPPVTFAPAPAAVPVSRRQHPPAAPVTLAAKRVGERDAERETADLLTDARLLEASRLPKAEPEGLWNHLVYAVSGRRINLGDSRRARERKELDRRIAVPLEGGARFVVVLSRKGGVGKTTVTALLGMALADAREDRVIAVDANPDRGTLAERIGRPSGKTVRDLSRSQTQVHGFNEISAIVTRDDTRLDVLASDADPRISDEFSDEDYRDVAELAAHYYSIVLTDTGTGIVHSVMDATLALADGIVVVAGLSVDEARLASETLTWLETNGYAELARNSVVALNASRPGTPLVRQDELEEHFRSRVRAVVRVPYDLRVATGSAISFRELQPATRESARTLAATVVEGLRAPAPVA